MGVPYAVHGVQLRSTQQTKRCRQFAERLADEAALSGIRVWWSDANDSSAEAAHALAASGARAERREALLDAVAAAVILARAVSGVEDGAAAAVPRHVAPARHVAAPPPVADRQGAGMEWYRELKLDAPPPPPAAAAPARSVRVELLRRARGGGAAARLQSWGELGIDEEDDVSPSAALTAQVDQLG